MHREDLADFLRRSRAAVDPASVGLPVGPRRRAPGLRREEVALLAGVSVTWYTWLEQGRPINASRSVLDALARALRLDEAQHEHLLTLAADEDVSPAPVDDPPPDALVRLLESFDPNPAYVLGPRWEYLAWNRAQGRLYPRAAALADEPTQRNLLTIVFTDPSVRSLIRDWEDEARRLLTQFRADTAARRHDPIVLALVDQLTDESPEFASWWAQHDVSSFHTHLRHYHHPAAGDLTFEFQQLTPVEWPTFRVVVQLGLAGDDSVARLAAVD